MGWDGGGAIGTIVAQRRTNEEAKLWRRMGKAGDIGKDLSRLFQELGAIAPSKYEQTLIAGFLGEGRTISFWTVVCPDYAVQTTRGKVSYTFDSLGTGVGIVAARALEVCLRLGRFFAERDMAHRVKFVLAMADLEANEANCERVDLDIKEFLARMRKSQQALAERAGASGYTFETPFLTEIDPGRWEASRARAVSHVGRLSQGFLLSACHERHPFYERWAGRCMQYREAEAMFLSQVEEYVAVGDYLSADGRVILGLDSPIMAPFVRHGASATPVIYFRRPDY